MLIAETISPWNYEGFTASDVKIGRRRSEKTYGITFSGDVDMFNPSQVCLRLDALYAVGVQQF